MWQSSVLLHAAESVRDVTRQCVWDLGREGLVPISPQVRNLSQDSQTACTLTKSHSGNASLTSQIGPYGAALLPPFLAVPIHISFRLSSSTF